MFVACFVSASRAAFREERGKRGSPDQAHRLAFATMNDAGTESKTAPAAKCASSGGIGRVKRPVIVSLDVEATGTSPVTSSVVMIGMVAVWGDARPDPATDRSEWVIDEKFWCLKQQHDRKPSEACWTEFWLKNMTVWDFIQQHQMDNAQAMQEISDWLRALNKDKLVLRLEFVAHPASYDWQWLNCVYDEFGAAVRDKFPLPYSITCSSTLDKLLRRTASNERAYTDFLKNNKMRHSHLAHEDALKQAYQYLRMLQWMERNSTDKDKDENQPISAQEGKPAALASPPRD